MRVAQYDPRAHADQLVHEEHTRLEHLFVNQRRTLDLTGDDGHDAGQVRRKPRPRAVVDLGNHTAGVRNDAQPLSRRYVDRVAVHLPSDPEFRERDPRHLEVMRVRGLDRQVPTGHLRQPDEAADLHEVGADGELGSVEAVGTADTQDVGTDTGDFGPHRVEHPAEVLHVRLAGGVLDDRFAACGGRGHDRVLRGGYRGFIQEDLAADQTVGAQTQHTVVLYPRAQPLQRQNMGVESTPADHVAARRREHDLAAARQERPGKQDRSANFGGQLLTDLRRVERRGLQSPGVGAVGSNRTPEALEDAQHDANVGDVGNVAQCYGLAGQHRRGDARKRGVLVAAGTDRSACGIAAVDFVRVHTDPFKPCSKTDARPPRACLSPCREGTRWLQCNATWWS